MTKEFSIFPSIAVSGYFVIAQFVVLFISTTNSHQACERKGRNGQPIKGTLRSQDTFRSIKASLTDLLDNKTVTLFGHVPDVRKKRKALNACGCEESSFAKGDMEDRGKRRFGSEAICGCFQVP